MARGIAIEGEPRHRGLHLPPKIILPAAGLLAALAVGGYALSRVETPTINDSVPQTQGQGVDVPPPAGSDGDGEPPKKDQEVAIAAPLPTEVAPPLQVEPSPLPNVINSQTVNFVSLPESEIITLLNQQKELKIPLPDIPSGLSIKEIKSKTGHSMLAIYGQATNLDLPVLLGGEVLQLLVGKSANYSAIAIKTPDGKLWGYVVPSPARSNLKEHDQVKLGQTAISLNYTPGNPNTEDFRKYAQKQYIDSPSDIVAVITGLNPNGTTVADILRTQEGSVATTGATLK